MKNLFFCCVCIKWLILVLDWLNKSLYIYQKKNFKEENIFTQHQFENKQLKEQQDKLRREENEKL